MNCVYAIFCESIKVDPSSNQITAEKMFSSLSLEEPGTTPFIYVLGVSGIEKGSNKSILVNIHTPDKRLYSAPWESPLSEDKQTVYNAIYNCSQIPFNVEGTYFFEVLNQETQEIISTRPLNLSFKKGSGN